MSKALWNKKKKVKQSTKQKYKLIKCHLTTLLKATNLMQTLMMMRIFHCLPGRNKKVCKQWLFWAGKMEKKTSKSHCFTWIDNQLFWSCDRSSRDLMQIGLTKNYRTRCTDNYGMALKLTIAIIFLQPVFLPVLVPNFAFLYVICTRFLKLFSKLKRCV